MADIASTRRGQLAPGTGDPPISQLSHKRPADNADDSGTDTDDEGRLIQQAAATAKMRGPEAPRGAPAHASTARPLAATAALTPAAGAPLPRPAAPTPRPLPRPPPATTAKGKAAPKRPAGAITLRTLLDAGFLVPGCKVLYVEYKGLITWADLTEEGTILCDGQAFESPSAFSIFVKRKLNPERKADDGWKAVKYAGKLLEHFKEQYLRQQLAASGLGGGTLRGATPSGSVGGAAAGPSPHSSVHQSPQRNLPGGDASGADEDGPPSKRQRLDGEGDGPGGPSRPGLKIKLKLKDAPGGSAVPAPAGGPGRPYPPSGSCADGRLRTGGMAAPAPAPTRTGPLLPQPAPAVAQVACGTYKGVPGSGEPGAQPFRLQVSEMVVIVMDFHAHCSSSEVGGLLGGTYDAAARTVTVSRAFPVLELPPPPSSLTNATTATSAPAGYGSRPAAAVEFDSVDLTRVTEVIRNWGLSVVGAYRSHPAYTATPNALDVRYAARAQEEARTADGVEPYVTAILSPYDPVSPSAPSSAITWFHVEYDRSKPLPSGGGATAPSGTAPQGCQPMSLAVEMVANPTAHMDIMNLVATQFQHTARTYAMRSSRVPLAMQWRPAGHQPPGSRPQTCLDKLVASVASRLPDMFEGDLRITYGSMVRDMVQHEFSLAERGGGAERSARAGSTGGGSEGGGSEGGGLALERSRRGARGNGVMAAVMAARFDSDEEETEDDEVRLDNDDELDEEDE